MFFFIGGIQPKTVIIDKQLRTCITCGYQKVHLKRVDHYLSIFFIPLFPVKRGTPFLYCENCSSTINEQGTEVKSGGIRAERRCPRCRRAIADVEFSYCPYCGKHI